MRGSALGYFVLLVCKRFRLSVRKSVCFLLPVFVLAWGRGIVKSFVHIRKAPTNILIAKKIPLVAQILGNGFKQKTRKGGTLNEDQRADECRGAEFGCGSTFTCEFSGITVLLSILSRQRLVVKQTSMSLVLLR